MRILPVAAAAVAAAAVARLPIAAA